MTNDKPNDMTNNKPNDKPNVTIAPNAVIPRTYLLKL